VINPFTKMDNQERELAYKDENEAKMRGAWVAQLVEHLTLHLNSGLEFKPCTGIHTGHGAYLKKEKKAKK